MPIKRICLTFVLLLIVGIQSAFAMGSLIEVTKETQAKLGLKYTLVADKVDREAVLVNIEIHKTGKLKNLRSVSLSVGSGRPRVYAPLLTSPGKGDSIQTNFQLSPELAAEGHIDIVVPSSTSGMEYEVYSIAVKGYIKERK